MQTNAKQDCPPNRPADGSVYEPPCIFARDLSRATVSQEAAEPNTPAVEFRQVSFAYEDKKVIENLSFKLAKGEIRIVLSGSRRRQINDLETDPGPY